MRTLRSFLGISLLLISSIHVACGDKDEQDSGSSDGGDASGEDGGDSSGEEGGDSSGEEGGDSSGEETGGEEGGDDGGSGGGDSYAQTACGLLSGDLESIVAASTVGEASQALIVPSDTQAWSVQNAGSDSYVMMEVEDWMVTVRLFATEGIDLEIIDIEQTAEQTQNAGCVGYTDQAFSVHEWGSWVIHAQGEGDFVLSAIQEE
jgi:hypothetical protein